LSRQGRSSSSCCPRCQVAIETPSHVFYCPNLEAKTFRTQALSLFLSSLTKNKTSIHIIQVLECKLPQFLKLDYMDQFLPLSTLDLTAYSTLLSAVWHQNIIGWQLFIKGYTSDYWKSAFHCLQGPNMSGDSQHWAVSLVSACIVLCKAIWDDRIESSVVTHICNDGFHILNIRDGYLHPLQPVCLQGK